MKKSIAAVAGLAASCSLAHAQRDFSQVEITTTKVAENVYMLQGAGGNIGVSVGEDGVLVIDDQFAPLAPKIVAAIQKLSDKPIAFVVNTHFHGDHTGANAELAALGAHIVAHDNVRARLKTGVARPGGPAPTPAPIEALPVVTFPEAVTFHWNGDEIKAWHPAPSAHTDGDAFISFQNANVVHMGDVFFNGAYPFIDLAAGGSLDGAIAAQEAALATMNAEVKIIPGHGAVATKADLERTVALLKDIRARVAALVKRKLSEDDVVKADPLKDLNPTYGTGFINGEQMTRTAYQSLSKPAKK